MLHYLFSSTRAEYRLFVYEPREDKRRLGQRFLGDELPMNAKPIHVDIIDELDERDKALKRVHEFLTGNKPLREEAREF